MLLSAGTKGKRVALPNSRILIHQVLGGAEGQASDIKIQAEEILTLKEELNRILAKNTGQPYEKVDKDTDRDYYMRAKQAKEYGLIDKIMERQA